MCALIDFGASDNFLTDLFFFFQVKNAPMAINANFTIQRDNIKLSFQLLMSSGPKQRPRQPWGKRRRGVGAHGTQPEESLQPVVPAQKLCGKPEAALGLPAAQAGPRGAVLSGHSVPGPAVRALTWGWTSTCRSQRRSWRRCQRCPSAMTPTAAAGPCAPLRTGGSWTAPTPALASGTNCSHFIPLRAWTTAAHTGALSCQERSRLCKAGCAPSTAGLRSAMVCTEQVTGAIPSLVVLSTNGPWRPSTLLCCSAQLCPLAGFPCTASTSWGSTTVSPASPQGSPFGWTPAMKLPCFRKPLLTPMPPTGTTGPSQLQGHPLPSK